MTASPTRSAEVVLHVKPGESIATVHTPAMSPDCHLCSIGKGERFVPTRERHEWAAAVLSELDEMFAAQPNTIRGLVTAEIIEKFLARERAASRGEKE